MLGVLLMAETDQPDFFGNQTAGRAATASDAAPGAHQPLAARMRPRSLDEIVGQEQLTAPGSLLAQLISTDRFGSLLFYGPPGCGKTSFAEVIARETGSRFVRINAVMSNVAELREILGVARKMPESRILRQPAVAFAQSPFPVGAVVDRSRRDGVAACARR